MLKFKAALLAPFPFWPLVVAIGAGPTFLAGLVSGDLLLPAGLAAMLLQVFLFGRILSPTLPDRVFSYWGFLREYGACYFLAVLVVGIFTIAVQKAVWAIAPPQLSFWLTIGSVKGAVAAITIYVWPLVFLQRSSLSAVLAGISVFFSNFFSSIWIVGIALVGQMVLLAAQLAYHGHRSGFGFAVLLVAGVVYVYLAASSFAAALYSILDVRISGADDQNKSSGP